MQSGDWDGCTERWGGLWEKPCLPCTMRMLCAHRWGPLDSLRSAILRRTHHARSMTCAPNTVCSMKAAPFLVLCSRISDCRTVLLVQCGLLIRSAL